MKRNRDAIAQMAIYDLLCTIQKNGHECVIQLLTGENQDKRCEKHESGWVVTQCRDCIAEWLNERSE